MLDQAGRLDIEALNRYAEDTGALAARAAAVVRREEQIEARMEALAEARAGAISGLKQVYKKTGKPPAISKDREARKAWLQEVRPALVLTGIPEHARAAVRTELAAALRRASWPNDQARSGAAWAIS